MAGIPPAAWVYYWPVWVSSSGGSVTRASVGGEAGKAKIRTKTYQTKNLNPWIAAGRILTLT